VALLLLGLALSLVGPAGAALPPAEEEEKAFFPLLWRGARGGEVSPLPTLGPSPTLASTAGPSPTPAGGDVAVATAASSGQAWPGCDLVFSVGFVNLLPQSSARVTLTEALPGELSAYYAANLNCPQALLTYTNTGGTAVVEVAPGSACQLVVATRVSSSCGSCQVRDTVTWWASWPGGGRTGTSYSQPVLILDAPPTATPTLQPSATPRPTLGPSPTPTPGGR
jgi:hypothetical protein